MGHAQSVQTKLHSCALSEDWSGCMRRLRKSQGAEARVLNSCGDLPLHLACYTGNAPPDILRALIDAYPNSLRMPNKLGRDPLELASINYHVDHPYRAEVLFLLRWHLPGRPSSNPFTVYGDDPIQPHRGNCNPEVILLPADIFSRSPPDNIYMASTVCVACMDHSSNVAMLPCGHICLCRRCVCSTSVLRCGKCPVGRCEVLGLYQLEEKTQEEAVSVMHAEEKTLCCGEDMDDNVRVYGRIEGMAC